MNRQLVLRWAALLLLPMVPVVIFYLVFRNQNYFELENAARGIVATGPIAAYVALVLIGWGLYRRLSTLINPIGPLEEKLLDTAWAFEAFSFHGTQRRGAFKFTLGDRGELRAAGTFEDPAERDVGHWRSKMTYSSGEQLDVIYDLDTFSGPESGSSTGMLSLTVSPTDPNRMTGNWSVMGRAEAQGNIECTRES